MRFGTIVLGGFALALAACAIPQTDVVARLGSDPVVSGGTYTSGGGISVAVDLREIGGLTAVCGVWAMSRQQSVLTKFAERQVLGSSAVYLGRDHILSNFLYMQRVDPAPSYGGEMANCALTDRVWRAGDPALKPVIRIPRQIVADESDGYGGLWGIGLGGPVIWFRQTGPGAGEG